MKETVEKILTDIDQEIEEFLSSIISDGRKRTVSSDELFDSAKRMQQLKNAHIMICNAFGEESKHEKGIKFHMLKKRRNKFLLMSFERDEK